MKKEREIKAALFDFDGTLVDTERQYSVFWSNINRIYCNEIEYLADIIKGTTLVQIFERYFPDKETRNEVTRMLNDYEANMVYSFFPGALDFVKDLKSHGVKCAIVTSSNIPKMISARKCMPEIDFYFDRIFTSEDFTASKPDPDCYLRAQESLGVSKEECIIFEDAFSGLQAGVSSGIFTVGLATTNSRESLSGRCDLILDSFTGVTFDIIQSVTK